MGINRPGGLAAITLPMSLGTPAQITGTSGVWVEVTPAGIDLNVASNGGDNYGVQDVIADPSRPGVFYAFVCYQGVWETSNYGLTWFKVSETANMDAGKNWGADIAPDGSYMLSTQGGRFFVMKSTDRGRNWTLSGALGGHEPYNVAISPYNKARSVIMFHDSGYNRMWESLDSGDTYTDMGVVNASLGQSAYVHYLHNSDTVLIIPETAGQGSYRGAKSGGTWTFSAITDLADCAHAHGGHQIFYDVPNGAFFAPFADTGGDVGIYKSTNNGTNWTQVQGSPAQENAIIGTATTLYAMNAFPIGSGSVDPKFTTAPRNPGTSWAATTDPAGMDNGAKRFAVGTDGVKWVVLSGNWHEGLWRYVE